MSHQQKLLDSEVAITYENNNSGTGAERQPPKANRGFGAELLTLRRL